MCAIAYAPDLAAFVVCYEQRAVRRNSDADRPTVCISAVGCKPCQEIFQHSDGLTVGERDESDFVANVLRAVPGTVLPDKSTAAVFGRELRAGIERQAERSRVSSCRKVGHGGFSDQIGALPFLARVLILSEIGIRPAIECAIAHGRDVI